MKKEYKIIEKNGQFFPMVKTISLIGSGSRRRLSENWKRIIKEKHSYQLSDIQDIGEKSIEIAKSIINEYDYYKNTNHETIEHKYSPK